MKISILEGSGVKATKKSLDETIAWSKESKITKKIDGKLFGWIGTIYPGSHRHTDVVNYLNRIRSMGYYVREYPGMKTTSVVYARKK